MSLVGVKGVAGEQQLFRLARPEFPRVPEVLDTAHPESGADDVGEHRVLARDDEIATPREHQPRGQDHPVHFGNGDLAEISPPPCVLEEVVPFLPVPRLDSTQRPAVALVGGVLTRAWRAFADVVG